MLVILCFVGLFAQSLAQIRGPGSCPQPNSIPNFDETKLIGKWFEWARIDNYWQPDHVCGKITYYRGNDGYLVEHYDTLIRSSGGCTLWAGKMIPKGKRPTALYTVTFPKYSRDRSFEGTYVAADFDHWVILHGCRELGNEALQFVWIWSKDPNLEQQHQDKIVGALAGLNLTMQNFSMIDHNKCPKHNCRLLG